MGALRPRRRAPDVGLHVRAAALPGLDARGRTAAAAQPAGGDRLERRQALPRRSRARPASRRSPPSTSRRAPRSRRRPAASSSSRRWRAARAGRRSSTTARHAQARAHVARCTPRGDDVLVQPYLDAVDGDEGEIALVYIEGELSHAMHKGPLLALDLPAVQAGFGAEQMSLVAAPAPDVVALGRRARRLRAGALRRAAALRPRRRPARRRRAARGARARAHRAVAVSRLRARLGAGARARHRRARCPRRAGTVPAMARVLIRGSGDVGSAVAHLLLRSGHEVVIHDVALPAAPRRGMAFADAIFDGACELDGVRARRAELGELGAGPARRGARQRRRGARRRARRAAARRPRRRAHAQARPARGRSAAWRR